MSQLKHRIAIGKVVDGEWKFDHYAGFSEHKTLRVNQDGAVERAFFGHGDGVSGNIYGIVWQDVSDTHRIEWGIKTYDKHGNPLDIYDGDIFVDWNTGADGVSTRPIIFELLTCASCVSYDEFPMIEILGNIHENPELLEAGK